MFRRKIAEQTAPRSHQGEVRLAARLAAVYHNALVQKNIRMEAPDCNALRHAPPEEATEELESNYATAESIQSFYSDDWDENEFGDRTYHDSTFETNEDLLPWNMRGVKEDERWGL